MKRQILYLLLALVCISAVHASTPNFNITTDLQINTTNGNGMNFGRIIVTKTAYTPQQQVTGNFSPITIQQYDELTWNGTDSISVKNGNSVLALLASGEKYAFKDTGVFTITSTTDITQSATVAVTIASNPVIAIGINGGNLHFSSVSPITLDTTEKIFNITADVDQDLSPGTYNYTVLMNSTWKNISNSYQIYLNEMPTWNITTNDVPQNISVKGGDAIPAGQIYIQNTGNKDLVITSEVVGTGSIFVTTQKQQTLFRKMNTFFAVSIQVPQRQLDGVYNATIILRGGNNETRIPINIIISDRIAPEVKSFAVKDISVYHQNEITADITDNINTTWATISWGGNNTFNMTKDQQLFSYKGMFTELTPYTFTVCGYDNANNSGCNTTTYQFQKMNSTFWTNTFRVASRKYGKFAQGIAINLTENVPVGSIRITLVDFSSDLIYNKTNVTNMTNITVDPLEHFKVHIIDGDGNTKMINKVGEFADVAMKGNIKLEIQGDQVSTYQGILNVSVPSYINGIGDMRFDGKFLDYDVPNGFTRDWYGKQFSCTVTDTGDLETSTYNCYVAFPISTEVENLAVPTSPAEKKLEEDRFNATIVAHEKTMFKYNVSITLLIAFLLVSLILVIYTAKYHPYVRLRFGGGN